MISKHMRNEGDIHAHILEQLAGVLRGLGHGVASGTSWVSWGIGENASECTHVKYPTVEPVPKDTRSTVMSLGDDNSARHN